MDALQQSFKYAFEASKFIKNGPELKGLTYCIGDFRTNLYTKPGTSGCFKLILTK